MSGPDKVGDQGDRDQPLVRLDLVHDPGPGRDRDLDFEGNHAAERELARADHLGRDQLLGAFESEGGPGAVQGSRLVSWVLGVIVVSLVSSGSGVRCGRGGFERVEPPLEQELGPAVPTVGPHLLALQAAQVGGLDLLSHGTPRIVSRVTIAIWLWRWVCSV